MSQRYIATVSAAFLLALSFVAVAFYFATQRTERSLDHSRQVTAVTGRVLALAVDRETSVRGFLLTGDSTTLQPELIARGALPVAINTLIQLTAENAAQSKRAFDIDHTVNRWEHEFAYPILESRAEPAGHALAGKALFDDIRRSIAALLHQESILLAAQRSDDRRMRTLSAVAFILESLLFSSLLITAYAHSHRQGKEVAEQYELLAQQAAELEVQSAEAIEQASALAASENRYRTLFDNLPVGVIMQGRDSVFQIGNNAAAELLGVPVDELRGHPSEARQWRVIRRDRSAFPAEQLPGVRSLRTNKRETDTVGVIHDDGRLLWLSVTAEPVRRSANDAAAEAVISFVDVTAQHTAEDSLLTSVQLMEAVLKASPVAIMTLDNELSVTSWNRGAELLFGWTAVEIIGTRNPIIPDSGWTDFLGQHADLLSQERITDVRRMRRRKDGSPVAVSVSASVLHDDAGGSIGVVMVAVDLTERERLETDLRQAQKMDAVGQLAGGVAHDFNNLLTIILSYAQMHLAEVPKESGLADDLREISDAAMRAAALTRQLLTFSRRQVIAVTELDLNEVVENVTPMLSRLLGSAVELSTTFEPNLWTCLMDRGQLEQVIMNLAVNARDAMPDGGPLIIGTANIIVHQDEQRYEGMPPGRYVTLCVHDRGVGMDPSTRSHIFEPFFTTKAAGEGTGLGLATVYGIVKQSQGFIQIDSEIGRGTEFRVSIPVTVDVAPIAGFPALSQDVQADSGVMPGTILVVDDVTAIRTLSRSILERRGHTVLEAANGEKALQLIAASGVAIDLVISDIEMPHMGGLELMRRLGEQYPHIPIMLVSGYSEELLLRRGVLSRRVAFIEKPYTPATLISAVGEVLRRAHHEGRIPLDSSAMPLVAIVDDTELNRVLAAAILEDACLVLSHPGGRDTVRDLAARKPALILLDIDMPELDGFQVLRGIRENATLRFVPVVAFTARVSDADRRMFESAGFDDYIGKPITDFEAFRARVMDGVSRVSTARAPAPR